MTKINWTNILIAIALAAGAGGLFLPALTPSVAPQSFQCAPQVMCVTNNGKTVTFPSGSTLTADSGSTVTIADLSATTITANGVSFTGPVKAITGTIANGGLITHGLATKPGYVICGVHATGNLTETAYVSATNTTSVTVGIFDAAGAIWTGSLEVDCLVVP